MGWSRFISTSLAAASILIGLAAASPAHAGVLFSEDFESYAAGSNLRGQNGWAESLAGGGSIVTISSGTYLPGSVINGRALTGLGRENLLEHALALNPNAITTLLFTAYATTDAPGTSLQQLGFTSLGPGFTADQILWQANSRGLSGNSNPSWAFSYVDEFGRATYLEVPGGFDGVVTMGIVLDGVLNEVYGLYDYGSGLMETAHLSTIDAKLDALKAISVSVDHRSGNAGMEIDNIRVLDNTSANAVPEPSSIAMFAAGVGGLLLWTRRKRGGVV